MKRLVLVFISLIGGQCLAQTYNQRSAFLEIGYGAAVPFGKYESSDVSDSASGYATAGTNLNARFAYSLSRNFSIAAMIGSSVNRLNTTRVKTRFDLYADKNTDGVVSDMDLKKWSNTAFLAGGLFTIPLQKATVTLQFLAGYSRTKYPEYEITIYSPNDSDAVKVSQQATEVASAFCFDVGAGLQYNISELMFLGLNVNFLSTYPAFDEVITTSTYLASTPDETHRVHQRISLLNATAGIGFRF